MEKQQAENLESLTKILEELKSSIDDSNQNIKDSLKALLEIEKILGIKKKRSVFEWLASIKNK